MSASTATLNTVRYSGYRRLTLYVHCVQAPTTPITSAWPGPSRSSAIKFAAYDADKVAPLASEIGRFTFHADVTQVRRTSAPNRIGSGKVGGKSIANVLMPLTMTTVR